MKNNSGLIDPNAPWWRYLTGYHWFVFSMASLAWLFDCFDQQLFVLAKGDALKHLLPPQSNVNEFAGYATSIFICGWAIGGLCFGALGDRFGRARMLSITVLIYSVCTGATAFSQGWFDFALYRLLTGLGVGGVFGLAVALVADTLPDRARPGALGLLQASSAIGNIAAGLSYMLVAQLAANQTIKPEFSWQLMFLFGAIPALLCAFLQFRLKEPEKWVAAREAGRITGVKFGSYPSLFGDPRWRSHALWGMVLCVSGVIGLWGIGFFGADLMRDVLTSSLRKEGVEASEISSQTGFWIGVNSICQNVGGFFGMIGYTWLTQRIGRKPAFVIGYLAALGATIFFFQNFNGTGDIWMSGVMGFCQLGLFAGFAIYLPELFPLRLRSTGTSFCYNVGRFIAATGPLTFGLLQRLLVPADAVDLQKIDAVRNAASMLTVVFLVGLLAVAFLPETKGQPMPED